MRKALIRTMSVSQLHIVAMSVSFGLLLTGCVSSPPIISAPGDCTALLPETWAEGVPAPPLPDGETIGDWIAFSDAAVGKIDVANDRYRAAVGICQRFNARQEQAVKASRPKFLGLF